MKTVAGGSRRRGWLVVEDEAMVAMSLEDVITDLGLQVVGPVARLDKALPIAGSEDLAGAILDVNIAGEQIYPVAEVLAARSIPFVFVTGYNAGGLREDFRSRPVLQKPFSDEQVRELIAQCSMR